MMITLHARSFFLGLFVASALAVGFAQINISQTPATADTRIVVPGWGTAPACPAGWTEEIGDTAAGSIAPITAVTTTGISPITSVTTTGISPITSISTVSISPITSITTATWDREAGNPATNRMKPTNDAGAATSGVAIANGGSATGYTVAAGGAATAYTVANGGSTTAYTVANGGTATTYNLRYRICRRS